MNTVTLSDEELKVLYDLVRQSKINASAEELLVVASGQATSPLLTMVHKIMVTWQMRDAELAKESEAGVAVEGTEATS